MGLMPHKKPEAARREEKRKGQQQRHGPRGEERHVTTFHLGSYNHSVMAGRGTPPSVNPQNPILSLAHDLRDPTYYFDDGNLLLLVDVILFKVHSSVLARECEIFRAGSGPLGEVVMQGNVQAISIFNLKAEQFRNFLLMFYGLPTDQEYRLLISDTSDTSQLTITSFRAYLDVANLADRFAAPRLQAWAHAQLKRVTKSTDPYLSRYHLSPEYQLEAIRYAKRTGDTGLLTAVRKMIQLHFIWVSKDSPIQLPAVNTLMAEVVRERAVELYKNPSLRFEDAPLFGFLFCYVLSLGPEFGAKTPLLTWNDRVALLSAQLYLTPLPTSSLDLDWLHTISRDNQRGIGTPIECCPKCNFYLAWEAVFSDSYCRQLRENATPLFGISQLALLPYQRLQLSDLVEELTPADCQRSCAERVVDFVDACVQNSYVRLTQYCKDVE
ncbi:hypothetical protein FRC08_003253 [Ceratobasidium sp. 394]|nr:hypothetical protein FRC08_003253 [Ceratobasidium sp. 394]